MTVYVCKTCGRAMKATTKPTYCYADRMDHLENISDDDAPRMFLFSYCDEADLNGMVIEFPGDFRFDPHSGIEINGPLVTSKPPNGKPRTLDEFQNHLISRGIYANV